MEKEEENEEETRMSMNDKFRELSLLSDGEVELEMSKVRNVVMSYAAECEEEVLIRKLLRQQTNKKAPRDPMEIPFVRWVVKFLIENGFNQLASQYKTSLFMALNRRHKHIESCECRPWLHGSVVDQAAASASPPLGVTGGGVTGGGVTGGGVTSGSVTSDSVTSAGVTSGGVTSGGVTSAGVTSGSVTSDSRELLYHSCLSAVPEHNWRQLASHCQQYIESGKSDEQQLLSLTYKWLHQSCGRHLLQSVAERLLDTKPAHTTDVDAMTPTIGTQPQQSSPFSHLIGSPGLLRQAFISHCPPPPTSHTEQPADGGTAEAEGKEEQVVTEAECKDRLLKYFSESLKQASTFIWDDLQLSYMKYVGQEILDHRENAAKNDVDAPPQQQAGGGGGRLLVVDLTFKLYLAIQLHMPLHVANQYHRLSSQVSEDVIKSCGSEALSQLHNILHQVTGELMKSGELQPVFEQFNTLHWIEYYNQIMKLLEGGESVGGEDFTFLLPRSVSEFQVMNDAYRFSLQQCVPHDAVIRRLELDYQHPLFGTANLLDELGKYVMVVLRGGKIVLGFVRTVDQHTNVVLEHTIERVYVGDCYGEMPVGTFLIRGDNIILLCEVDSAKEALLPEKLKKLPAQEIMFAQKAEIREKEEKRKKMLKVLKDHQLPILEIHEEDAF